MLEAVGKMDVKVPMVVRMAGTRAEEGLKLLEGSPLIPAASPTEAAQKIIDLERGMFVTFLSGHNHRDLVKVTADTIKRIHV